jgi:hypothetical protein
LKNLWLSVIHHGLHGLPNHRKAGVLIVNPVERAVPCRDPLFKAEAGLPRFAGHALPDLRFGRAKPIDFSQRSMDKPNLGRVADKCKPYRILRARGFYRKVFETVVNPA